MAIGIIRTEFSSWADRVGHRSRGTVRTNMRLWHQTERYKHANAGKTDKRLTARARRIQSKALIMASLASY